jgi:Icc-related predicted phosphoesterase
MLVQYMSDIHLEFGEFDLQNPEQAEVLILAGDILVADDFSNLLPHHWDTVAPNTAEQEGRRNLSAVRYRTFLEQVNDMYKHVVVIAGNHEFYRGKWVKSLQMLRDVYAHYPNIHFLENDSYIVDDVTFVGATLWTDMNHGDALTLYTVTNEMSDFSIIRNDQAGHTKLRPAHTIIRHRNSLDYIKQLVSDQHDRKFVMVSHHAPTFTSVSDYHRDQHLINGAYASNLSEFILDHPQIQYWVHGHMHTHCDYLVGDTRVMCNPRGYVGSPEPNYYRSRYFNI